MRCWRANLPFFLQLRNKTRCYPIYTCNLRRHLSRALFILLLGISIQVMKGQDNYEIQVYGSETVAPNRTMVELHNNYTLSGSKQTSDGMWPTQGAWHETIEITHGWTPWFETGFYIFTSIPRDRGWNWVGDHIRPRVRVPESWHWPVGASISLEAGYQRAVFSPGHVDAGDSPYHRQTD